jgi:hypothetical protein
MPVSIQLSKILFPRFEKLRSHFRLPFPGLDEPGFFSLPNAPVCFELTLVGLGRFELPTSPLSGVRSNQLSYRPVLGEAGGAERDRTDDLLNANQALSQLSYSPLTTHTANQPGEWGCHPPS